MNKFLLSFFLFLISLQVSSQQVFSSHHIERVREFDSMRPIDSTDVVMLGSRAIEYAGDWSKLLGLRHIRNRGIAGDRVMDVYSRLGQILPGKPRVIVLLIGLDDLAQGLSPLQVVNACGQVISKIRSGSPSTKLYVQTLFPINDVSFEIDDHLKNKSNDLLQVNHLLHIYCKRHDIGFINLYSKFLRHGSSQLLPSMTSDGIHLSPFGYKVWAFHLKKYVQD